MDMAKTVGISLMAIIFVVVCVVGSVMFAR